jgi:hypothetical protein
MLPALLHPTNASDFLRKKNSGIPIHISLGNGDSALGLWMSAVEEANRETGREVSLPRRLECSQLSILSARIKSAGANYCQSVLQPIAGRFLLVAIWRQVA